MKQYLKDNNSGKLLIFFTGWGCDESEFGHIKSDSDVLILYDYLNLDFNFDFSKYKEVNLIAFSAGTFVASLFDFDFEINKNIAISGNPYLFDEKLGLSEKIQNVLRNITEENAEEFAKNYLVKTEEEFRNFHPSKRTLESCRAEFEALKRLYDDNKNKIRDIYNYALFGSDDIIFNLSSQREFYGPRLRIVENSRHNMFFRIENYNQFFNYCEQ